MKLLSESASIVMLGAFNPAIFHPSWLALKNLISSQDAQTADLKLIAPQFSSFKAGGIIVEVLPERFLAQADEPQDQVRLRDLVLGIFGVLAETPVVRMGLNWTHVFRLENEDKWHGVGDLLAPKAIWEGLLLGRPGLKTMTIQADLPDGLRGNVNVKVEPVPNLAHSVRVELNNDIAGPKREGPVTSETFLEIIQDRWELARKDGATIARELLVKAGAA